VDVIGTAEPMRISRIAARPTMPTPAFQVKSRDVV
jgi:hypothetical protein